MDAKYAPIEMSDVADLHESKQMLQPRVAPIHLHCYGLSYSVRSNGSTVQLLDSVTFEAKAGQMTAILGASGSGKTTLLECLMRRLRPSAGYVLWHQADKKAQAPTHFAFVEQHATLAAGLTVRETLQYAADFQLQGPQWPVDARRRWVNQMLQHLQLTECADVIVGDDSVKGISGGQRKRLAIGKELISMPSVLLLDEPTSGLDSDSAEVVIGVLAQVVRQFGCTIILIVHQASRTVYEYLDHIVVLACAVDEQRRWIRGRVLIRSDRKELLGLLADHSMLAIANTQYSNPAEHLLSLSKSGATAGLLLQSVDRMWPINDQQLTAQHARAVDCSPVPRTSSVRQFATLMRRHVLLQKRDPTVFQTRLFMYGLLCLFVGWLFNRLGNQEQHIHDRISLHMFTTSFLIALTVACMASLIDDKRIYRQETSNGHYSPLPYVLMQSLAPIPYLLLISSVCTCIQFLLIDLYLDVAQAAVYALNLACALYTAESMLLVIAVASRGGAIYAMAIGVGVLGLSLLLCGFYILPSHMNGFFHLLHQLTFQTYYFRLLLFNDLNPRTFIRDACSSLQPTNGTWPAACLLPGSAVLSTFEVGHVDTGQTVLILLGMAAFWRIVLLIWMLRGGARPQPLALPE